ncbi:CRISPR system precrRNA processing endoribonuclease RAMP protein Cas6 [Blastochloris sulfoviridis]|uniref:CRISPR system precrRNA processing endoribonuclease RAMP protein Cas6 n=1 Tax=Blastochloris sulfoviridis TaxID=50712 RepID=UPI0014790A99|nr:CRISPR system precrRNA processing endoribonuclease RAMP protein Cas6 [Blastochloris sulfoviridis]
MLPLLRLDLAFMIDEPVMLPGNRGNLWRGILGPALKRIDEGVLPGLSHGELAPGSLYDTFIGEGSRSAGAPRPYVIDAPSRMGTHPVARGDIERIGLTLIGRPASAVEAVLGAFDFAARVGLGAGHGRTQTRGRGHLQTVTAAWRNDGVDIVLFDHNGFRPAAVAEFPAVPPCPPRLRVILATPLRLVHDGLPIGPDTFEPGNLVGSLVQRVKTLSTAFCDVMLEPDIDDLKARWRALRASEKMLAFSDGMRWSGNQHKDVGAGGLIGSFMLDMQGFEPLFPYLWLGQWVHAGKGVVAGLGAIRLKPT